MKTLTSDSKILIHHSSFREKRDLLLNPQESSFLPSQQLLPFRFLHLLTAAKQRPIHPLSCISSKTQVVLETEDDGKIHGPCKTNTTVHVKFQLHKQCSFGDQFLIVGDHPMFGLWDPSCAIPLNWSDQHVWTVELDIPTGMSIQFKFILKRSTGDILWQPGPDRGFQTWETNNTITVSEDWDDAELQMISEEQVIVNQREEPFVNSKQLLIDADNLTLPKEESVEDNVENGKGSPVLNASNSYLCEDIVTYVAQESGNKEEVIGYNGRVPIINTMASTDTLGNQSPYEGDPVLVPGLTPVLTVPTEEVIKTEDDKRVAEGANDTQNHSVPESFKKQEHDDDNDRQREDTTRILHDEEQLGKEIRQNPHLSKEDEQPHCKTVIDNVLQSDVLWGRKTLQKLLSNLGLF